MTSRERPRGRCIVGAMLHPPGHKHTTAPELSITPRPHDDAELVAALEPFAADHLARLRADREQHGAAAATIMEVSQPAKFYGWMHLVCEGAVEETCKAGAL